MCRPRLLCGAPFRAARRHGVARGFAACISLVLLLQAPTVSPEEPTREEPTREEPPEVIVVTAEAPDAPPGPGVRVVDAEAARAEGHRSVAEAIEATPGISVQRRGSAFEPQTVRIRGSSAEQVLVLRDGHPLGNAGAGPADLSRLSLQGIERIEVVLGPATALYGGGGAAGAVNLVSARPQPETSGEMDIGGSSQVEYGSLGEYGLSGRVFLSAGATTGRLALDGTLSENRYDYDRGGETVSRENAGGQLGSATLGVTHERGAGRAELTAAVEHADRGIPGTVEFPSEAARLEETTASVDLALGAAPAIEAETGSTAQSSTEEPAPETWGAAGRVRAAYEERSFEDPEYPLGKLDSHALLQSAAAGVTARGPLGSTGLTLPASYSYEALTESELGERARWTVASAPSLRLPQLLLGASTLGLSVQGRGELVALPGEASAEFLPSARGGATWTSASQLLETSLAVSAGYRLPTYAELFWPAGAFAVGNPDLEPELSRGVELEIEVGRAGQSLLGVTGFITWYRRLIQWLPDPTGFWRPRNTGAAVSYGGEVSYRATVPIGLSPWSADGQAAAEALFALDKNEGPTYEKQLPYRPEYRASLSGGVTHLAGHSLGVELRRVGARPVNRQNTRWLDPYLAVDLAGSLAVPATPLLLRARVNNLLDREFVETRFQPNPGIEVVVSAEVSW